MSRLYIVTLLISLICRVHHEKCWAGWSTSWNQDCRKKSITSDMQMTPHLWRKWRTKELLDESERGEWKIGLKLNIQKTKIMAFGPITSWQIGGEATKSDRLYFFELQNHCRWWLQPWNSMMLAPWKESYDQPRQHVKKQRHYFANKGLSSQSYDFSISPVWMWELDYKESWVPKNWCFQTVVLEKTLESPLVCKEIQPVHPEGDKCSLEGLMLKLNL